MKVISLSNRFSLLERLGASYKERPKPDTSHLSSPNIFSSDSIKIYTHSEEGEKNTGKVQEASAFAGKLSVSSKLDILQELKLAIHRRIVDEMSPAEQAILSRGEDSREQIKNIISTYVAREMNNNRQTLTRIERQSLIDDISNELLGLGPLEPLLQDESITEIMVNGPHSIFVEQNGKLKLTDIHFYDNSHLMSIIERILTPLGRRVDESSPLVDARLVDGSRVNIIIPPLSLVGPAVTIRKFSKTAFSMNDLVNFGTLGANMSLFLEACVKARLNILVSGGTGSGKNNYS